jgi:oligoendopeptidase F
MFSAPTYILLNFTGRATDAQTIAHEMGHAINYEYIRRHQHALYFGTSLAIAETASTLMEDFVLEELAKDLKKPADKLAILMSQLNDSVSTIFRQIASFRFEQELHKNFRLKGYLSKEEIGKLFQKHMSTYMGPSVEQSSGSANWWVYWSHLRNYFYNYSYASGLLTSKVFQAEFKKDKRFIEKIKTFLSTGESLSPRDTMQNIGFDMTDPAFWQVGLKEIESQLKEAEKLAKI